jgi:hypothetical protein
LHTENQLPRLSGSALKVPGWVGSYPLLSQAPTPVEVELGCDKYILCMSLRNCLNHYSLTHLKVELDCLKNADTGANIHTSAAMTPVDMSKIIFNPLITILFIADTGTMAPVCVKIGPIKIKN